MAGGTKPKIFISYSRDDIAFADALEDGLKAEGRFEVLIDRHSIKGAEDWKQRLGALIRDCDTVIFVLSPDSVASPVCAWEVDEAIAQSKRIIPALWRPVDFSTAPHKLAALNAIPCDGANALLGMRRLIEALDADLEWLSEYTRIAARATEWDANGRDPVRLLRGAMLAEAHTWLARKPERAPAPTEIQLAYLSASDAEEARLADAERAREELLKAEKAAADAERARAEEARRSAARTRIGAIVAGALAVIASGAGFVAFSQSQVAQAEREDAEIARHEAEQSEQRAVEARAQAQEDRSQLLAAISEDLTLQGNAGNALVLAWMAVQPYLEDAEAGDVPTDAVAALRTAREEYRETFTLRGHQGAVMDATFSPDGSRILTISNDGRGALWDAATGERLLYLEPESPDVGFGTTARPNAAFSPDGDLLVLTFASGATVFDSTTGELVASLDEEQSRTRTAAFDPLGDRIVTTSDAIVSTEFGFESTGASAARLWDARTGRRLISQLEPQGLCAVAFSPDGRDVKVLNGAGEVRTLDAANAKTQVTAAQSETSVSQGGRGSDVGASSVPCSGMFMAYGADGSFLLTTAQNGWKLEDLAFGGPPIENALAHSAPITDIAIDPTGRLFATASADETVKVWDTFGSNYFILSHEDAVASAAFSPDGRRIVTTSDDDSIRVWSAETGSLEALMRGHEGVVTSAAFSPDGDAVVTGSFDGTARLWRLNPDYWVARLVGPGVTVNSVAFSPADDAVAVSFGDGAAEIWSVAPDGSWSRTASLSYPEPVMSTSFRSDGRAIVTASGFDLHILERNDDGSWSETASIPGAHEGAVRTAVFSRDGNTILTASDDTTARLWTRSADGAWTRSATLEGHTNLVYSAVFSADESLIATASEDATIRIWAPDGSGRWIEDDVLEGHTSTVYYANFNPTTPDEIVSASLDATARVWRRTDDGSWTSTAVLQGHTTFVSDADYSPDGAMIATVSEDRTVRLWGRDGGDWTTLAVLDGYSAPVYFSAFSPDGELLATADSDGATTLVRVADAIPPGDEELMREAGEIAVRRQLSLELCERYNIEDAPDLCVPPPAEECPCLPAFNSGDYATAFTQSEDWVASIEVAFDDGQVSELTAANAYGQHAWYALFARQFLAAEATALRGLEVDPGETYFYATLAHALAFQGRMDEAYAIYMNDHGATDWPSIVSFDIQDLRAANVTYPEMDAVLARINAFICPCVASFDAGDYFTAFSQSQTRITFMDEALAAGQSDTSTAASAYGQHAWYALFAREFEAAEAAARRGVELDPSQTWIFTNLAHALAFQGRMDEANAIYDDDHGHPNWSNLIANDIYDLRDAGVEFPEMDDVLARMGAMAAASPTPSSP